MWVGRLLGRFLCGVVNIRTFIYIEKFVPPVFRFIERRSFLFLLCRGRLIAVPPRESDLGLLTHVASKVSATLRSMSHVVECFSFAPTAMAQFP